MSRVPVYGRRLPGAALAMLLLAGACLGCSRSAHDWDAIRSLGSEQFTPAGWAAAEGDARGAMVYDLLQNHSPLGGTRAEVEQLLGSPDAYFEYDEFPAYTISDAAPAGASQPRLIAFVTSHDSGEVVDFVIEPRP